MRKRASQISGTLAKSANILASASELGLTFPHMKGSFSSTREIFDSFSREAAQPSKRTEFVHMGKRLSGQAI